MEKIKHITIGSRTAEELKILIGTALPDGRSLTADVRGRSTETGLPVVMDIDSQEIRRALDEPIQRILRAVLSILEKTPPELAADIADHGIVLTAVACSSTDWTASFPGRRAWRHTCATSRCCAWLTEPASRSRP